MPFYDYYTPTRMSAGTFVSEICFVCYEGGAEVAYIANDTPHPVYTDGKGNEIVQLDMVTLGGRFGLNN